MVGFGVQTWYISRFVRAILAKGPCLCGSSLWPLSDACKWLCKRNAILRTVNPTAATCNMREP